MTYFNPDTDLTIKKSQVRLGKSVFKFVTKTKKKVKIGQYYYQLLPESSPLLGKHFRSCAVVGNSGILLDSHCGPQIDSADFVFRSNLPDLEGFENDVGTKSNFTTMNLSVLPHEHNGYLKNTNIQEKFVNRLRLIHDQILHISAMISVNTVSEMQFITLMIVKHHLPLKVTFAPTSLMAKMTALWNDSEFKPKRASTGNLLFALAACLCDQIHLYGFYPEEFLTFHQRKALDIFGAALMMLRNSAHALRYLRTCERDRVFLTCTPFRDRVHSVGKAIQVDMDSWTLSNWAEQRPVVETWSDVEGERITLHMALEPLRSSAAIPGVSRGRNQMVKFLVTVNNGAT
ncbi:hypothetical protein Bbelb_424960 [Branchiostoma belcheri]|nr:hypothetical protein Bbelb_424960 [Branchiostoma belcheri]